MAEYYNVETRERRYAYVKPAGHGWVRADMFAQGQAVKDDDDDGLGSTLVTAAVTVGAELLGEALSGGGNGGSFGDVFSGGGGDFGGGGASGDF